MNLKEWAEKLNNCEYGNELSNEDRKQLKQDHMVIVYGSSDDLMEMDGAIRNEFSVYGETKTFYYVGKGNFAEENSINELLDYVDEEYPELSDVIADALCKDDGDDPYITVQSGEDCQFEYDTNIPCEWFNVMEDGELYCRGFVFDMKLLDNALMISDDFECEDEDDDEDYDD